LYGFERRGSRLKTSKLTSASIAAALAVTLAGCDVGQGQGGDGEEQQGQQQSQPTDARSQPSEAADGASEAASDDGQVPPQSGRPIATREVNNEGAILRVDITGLQRSDRFVTLTWNVTATEVGADGWSMDTKLGSGFVDHSVSAVTLIDTVNSLRYKVARSRAEAAEEPGACVCSPTTGTLQAGDTASYFATFTAPPPDVMKVSVDLVVLGAFNDVPIS
jgi:hypothetical protein